MDQHPRIMADVNGDKRADVVGFGNAGAYVSLSTGTGFSPPQLWVANYGYDAGGWRVEDHPRIMADVNGDGRADVVGFGNAGAYVSIPSGQRKSVNALTASELMSLRRGVAQMMAWNNAPRSSVDFRRSWVYWANMHAHFGADCAGPIIGSGMAGVQTFTASNPSETATWCTCEHGTVPFLTWHRMYLWYFERVLQTAAGDPSLRLPYWDYATDPNLPTIYREQTYVNEASQTVPNPLFVPARQTNLNNGSAGLSPGVRSAAGAMTSTTYNSFNSTLEGTPHGAVHCAVGVSGCPSGLMGSVPAAALDPIFYAHHTNIDRLYECWLSVNEAARLPSDAAHLNTQFNFVDADGSTPQRRVGDMLRVSELGYSYAKGGDCPAVPAVVLAAQGGVNVSNDNPAAAAGDQSIELAGPTRLERGVTTVRINIPPTDRKRLSAQAAPSARGRIYLVIEGLTFDDAPGALYNIYLAGNGGRREQIGVINFFNFTAPRAKAHGGHDSSAGRYTFDATEAVQRLSLDTAAQPSLVFEPTTGLTDSTPKAAADQISPNANVRFDRARLVILP